MPYKIISMNNCKQVEQDSVLMQISEQDEQLNSFWVQNKIFKQKLTFNNYALGRLTQTQLHYHTIFGFLLAVFLYFMAYGLYPSENHYSIQTKTYSNLGSFDKISNYRGWYFYSILQLISFFINFPMAFYQHNRLKRIGSKTSFFALILMLLGSICQFLICFFPASENAISGNLMWGDFHNNIGSLGIVFCMMGYVTYAVLVAMERTKCSKSTKFLPHYKVDLAIVQIMVFFITTFSSLLSWCFIYPVLKKKDPSLPDFRAASQYTFFCFTMWESIFVYGLYIFNFIFPLVLPFRADGVVPKQRNSQKMCFRDKTVELKTQLSKEWFKILNLNQIQTRNSQEMIEHLADYEEVEGLLTKEAVCLFKQLVSENEEQKIEIFKDFMKHSDELWQWNSLIRKCIK
ncbi:Conserved_hypothetical protein [Hexamita inflata]|uniref:Uncharacterized protein n=1 Tax=Hexamita inflata TaxID=28002 RepID=A0AA86PQ36_9EUKA|nr:Conserved hypothetical protein [Hexamita inflata]